MADLFALQACVRNDHPLPAPLATVTTPVVLDCWVFWLAPHPDRSFAEYICKGFREGFRIGFASGSPLRVSGRNLRSATAHAEVVDGYLYDEVRARRMLPLDASPYASRVHVSPFGVLPKPHQPGRWRLIVDLSAPAAASVNDGIDRRWCSLRYASIDDAVDLVRRRSLERCSVARRGVAFWPAVGAEDLLRRRGRPAVGHVPRWRHRWSPLPRRLSRAGPGREVGVRSQFGEGVGGMQGARRPGRDA